MLHKILITAALLASPAMAQDIPTEEQKKAALMEAYRRNGNSMVGFGSIDVTKPDPTAIIRPMLIAPPPVVTAEVQPEKPAPVADICTRHGKHRVATRGGKSWRCR
jgi:hypothetical protein